MEIKVGTLVKAWDNDASDFIVGEYIEYRERYGKHDIFVNSHDTVFQDNATPIPADLAKQLEELK